jgi:DNA transposition AAA+ family ATPase
MTVMNDVRNQLETKKLKLHASFTQLAYVQQAREIQLQDMDRQRAAYLQEVLCLRECAQFP